MRSGREPSLKICPSACAIRKRSGSATACSSAAIYSSESGFYSPTLNPSSNLGLADQGTRLLARFNNVPAGVQVYVGLHESGTTAANSRVRLINSDPTGAGAFSPVPGAPEAGGQLAPISLTAGAGQAVWEVGKADPNALETISVDVAASYAANQPSLATAFVTPGFAPLSAVAGMSATAPVPRFVLNNSGFGIPSPLFTITPCTNAAPQIFTVFRTFNFNLEAGSFFPGVQHVSLTSTAALNQDFSVNAPGNPAPAGSFLFLFGAGEGQTDPPGQDGKITGSVLARPRLPVSVRFSNTTVAPDYAGAAPGLVVGVLQVNVKVPDGLTPGPVPVVLRVGDQESPAGVTVFVK